MKLTWLGFFGCLFFIFSCGSVNYNETKPTSSYTNELMQAVLWHQASGERKALCYQAFNLARLKLDAYLINKDEDAKPAVIVDIDETIVDNSPFEGKVIKNNKPYPSYWNEWVVTASAKALPGAVGFLNYAASKDVRVFYISNRKEKNREFTKKNLVDLGFPNVEDQYLYLRNKKAIKDSLRGVLSVDYEIVLLMGDNLDDFSSVFKHKTTSKRQSIVDSLGHEFGDRFIVLPNAMYGDWEFSMYDYEGKTDEEKRKIREKHIIDFNEQ